MKPLAVSQPSRRRLLRWLLALALAGLGGFVAVSAFFAVRLTGRMSKVGGAPGAELPPETESVRFKTEDDLELAGWFLPRPGSRRAVVLLHGHQGTRRQMIARARFFHAQGYAVLLYDARGHGESAGELTSVGWFETRDLVAALDFVRARGGEDIGLIGMSQGAATIALAAERLAPVKWAVLESSYPTMRDARDRRFRRTVGVPGALAGIFMVPFAERRLGVSVDALAPIEHVGKLPCPVFILHGERDTHTFATAAEAIFARAPARKALWILPGAAHTDFYGFAKQDYERRLLAFIESAR